ncbi:MAG TPA: glycosyltransferase family 39 protein [Polyangiaceae bacterium]
MPSASVRPPAAEADLLPRLRIRDPDYWLVILAWATILFSVAQIVLFGFGRDQSIYAVVADAIQAGQMPYRDAWDFKPPGIHLVYALAQALFGRTMLAPRLLEVAGLTVAIYGLTQLSKEFVGIKRVGLIGGALAALIQAQMEFWHTCQPETFGGYLTILALWLTVIEYGRKRRPWAWLGVGALFGCAFLLKPPLGGGVLVCAAYFSRLAFTEHGTRRAALWPVLVMALGAALPIALCAAWFVARGAWGDLWWTLFEFTPGYTMLGWHGQSAPEMFYTALEEGFFKFSALAAFGVIAALVISPMHTREREGVFLVLGLVSVHLAGIAMQGKFFPYHYGATLPFVGFLAGIGLYKLWRRCLAGGSGGVLAFVSFLIVVASMRSGARDLDSFWDRSALRLRYLLRANSVVERQMLYEKLYAVADYDLEADGRVAREIKRRTDERDFVYVWGFEPLIYRLSGRRPASRFIYNVPQRVLWTGPQPRHELMRDLARTKPAIIVVQRYDFFRFVTGENTDSRGALAGFPKLDELIRERYELATSIEDFELYERRK